MIKIAIIKKDLLKRFKGIIIDSILKIRNNFKLPILFKIFRKYKFFIIENYIIFVGG
ncbi:hypothetical protein GX420_04265 [bacterium]|nr:hypothetical protein [bacterium]